MRSVGVASRVSGPADQSRPLQMKLSTVHRNRPTSATKSANKRLVQRTNFDFAHIHRAHCAGRESIHSIDIRATNRGAKDYLPIFRKA